MAQMTLNPPDPMIAQYMAQHPMHAVVAPLGPPPKPLSMADMAGMGDQAMPTMSAQTPQVRGMTPLEQYQDSEGKRMTADLGKDANPYGSPTNHPGVLGKFLHGLSVATGGPNRRQFEEENLGKQLEGEQKEQSAEGLQNATAEHTRAETPEVAPNAESLRALQGAETGHAEAETETLGKPQLEIHDTEDGPILVNKSTGVGQHVTVDGQPVGPKLKLTESQPIIDPSDNRPHTYMLDENGNKKIDLGVHYERPISVNAGSEKNLWSVPQPDGSKKVVELRPGDTIPSGAVSLSGQSQQNSKEGSADAPTISALKFANDYLASGAFTGPSDEALQDQFFQMAKPSTGFRMNQAQIDQLHNMTSWMNSVRGRLYHATNGVWFAPEQRTQIVKTMNDLGKSKGINPGSAQEPQRPANVPAGYTFNANGPKGAGWYAPTTK